MIELPLKKEHKGTLRQARLYDFGLGKQWVEGLIYGHPGFRDGDYIHTSSVVDITGNVVETRNSLYTVEWAPGHPATVFAAWRGADEVPSEQIEDSPITPSVPVNVEATAQAVPDDGRTYARILHDECGAPVGTIVVVDRFLADGAITYTDGTCPGILASAGRYEFVSDDYKTQEQPDEQLLVNIAEQFVTLFDAEELRHTDIEYFASAFKDALRS